VKKIAQNVTQPIFLPKLTHLEKKYPKKSGNLPNVINVIKTTQSKQSPNGRKFAQSGHPGDGSAAVNAVVRFLFKPANELFFFAPGLPDYS
jgi:hypothetical protein